jgi:hypothetical protein
LQHDPEDTYMSNPAPALEPAAETLSESPKARKLLQAAALAALLVPLGTVAVETAVINCASQGSGSCSGTFFSGGGSQSNVWKFFQDTSDPSTLLYSFEIAGTPTADFTLFLRDVVTTQAFLLASGALVNFPQAVCIPTYDATQCGLFDVFGGQNASWQNSAYDVTISWFTNANPLSQPPNDGFNTILQAKDNNGGFVFGNTLQNIAYDPAPTPTDPAIGGRGDSFSRFGAFRIVSVPEPGTLLLVAIGIAGGLSRSRWKKRSS